MWEYYSDDCPEPRRNTFTGTSSNIVQQTQGQYEAQIQQLCDLIDTRQADVEHSTAERNGVLGWEIQHH